MLGLEGEAPDRAHGRQAGAVPGGAMRPFGRPVGDAADDAISMWTFDARDDRGRGSADPPSRRTSEAVVRPGPVSGGDGGRGARDGAWSFMSEDPDGPDAEPDGKEAPPEASRPKDASLEAAPLEEARVPAGGEADAGPDGKVSRLHPPRVPHQASLDRAVQAQIGAQLRTLYEHYVDQPIPERLVDLVERLGEARSAGLGDGTAPAAAPPAGPRRPPQDGSGGEEP